MFSGRGLILRLHASEGQQLVDSILRMTRDDLCEHIAQIGLRIEAVHPNARAAVGAGEEMVLAPERDGTDCALDDI